MTEQKVKKPIYRRWWFWVITVVVILGVIGSIGGEEPAKEAGGPAEQEQDLNFQGTLEVSPRDGKIDIVIDTNVPDGGLFEVSIITGQFETVTDVLPVQGGKVEHEFAIPDDWEIGYYSAIAMFRFNLEGHPQPEHIKAVYGEAGEKMEGDLSVENNLGGKNGNVEPVTFAYPNQAAVTQKLDALFVQVLDEVIEASDGILLGIRPSQGNNWGVVYVTVSDAWYYSADHEKERFAEQVGGTIANIVLNAQKAKGVVDVYFDDAYGKRLASPKMLGGYKIER
ncbi:MAG TPA: hypothetical protein GX711_05245 [Clostridia bacterium]|nr:hypothetical protein [Clostridia bacterium]